MNTLIHRLQAFIRKDTASEGESNDFTVLLRALSILFGIYYIFMAVVLICCGLSAPALFSFLMLLAMTIIFGLSYIFLQRNIFIPFIFTILFSSIVNTFWFGWYFGYILMIFLGIPLFYYNARLEIVTKNICAGIASLAIIVLTTVSFYIEPVITITGKHLPARCLFLANVCLFAFSISMISYFFSQKFIEAEHKLYQYNKKLKQMASRDPLTGLMNRRSMNETLTDIIGGYHSSNRNFSIAIGDIDFFKRFNDTYGHDCGDYVLKSVSDLFLKFMEGKGEVCRWGGEEFLFVFTSDNADDIFLELNDLRHMIKHSCFTFEDKSISITMTFGLEEFSSHSGIEATIKKADEKLYLGKESGRDKVVY